MRRVCLALVLFARSDTLLAADPLVGTYALKVDSPGCQAPLPSSRATFNGHTGARSGVSQSGDGPIVQSGGFIHHVHDDGDEELQSGSVDSDAVDTK